MSPPKERDEATRELQIMWLSPELKPQCHLVDIVRQLPPVLEPQLDDAQRGRKVLRIARQHKPCLGFIQI